MTIRDQTGSGADGAIRQVWTVGGVQLISDPAFDGTGSETGAPRHHGRGPGGRAARGGGLGRQELPQGRNWLALPDGLNIEILQANGTAVADALAIDPRA